MKPVIGIISRSIFSEENNKMYGIYDEIARAVELSDGIPIGIIINNDIEETLRRIDGLIFQGGDDFTDCEKKIVEVAHRKNIKTLGICLGMQLMGTVFDGKLIEIENHKYKDKDYVHQVNIKKDSTLYNIFNTENINVNSRHHFILIDTSLEVVGIADDNSIEAIEDRNKDFFIGIQWHPESMLGYDYLQQKLFKYFVDKCGERI